MKLNIMNIISSSVIFAEKNLSQKTPQKHRRHFYIPENRAVKVFGLMGRSAMRSYCKVTTLILKLLLTFKIRSKDLTPGNCSGLTFLSYSRTHNTSD